MTYRDAKTMTARGQVQLRLAKRAAKAIGTFQCLIVSADRRRSEMLEHAAIEGGWRTTVCLDAKQALAHVNRSFVHLAIVDLDGQDLQTFRPVLAQLTSLSGALLIVCGKEGDVEEEVCVRQLGAWMYLPGVVEGSNLALLCGEARQIAERLAKAAVELPRAAPAGQETFS
jgi:DNA-binding NtrC family response regulator